jgi:ketosteroid isomerase-like protein
MTESEAILAADANRRAAMISANRNQLESIFSERLVWTHSSGAVEHREAFIANIESGSVRYLELDTPTIEVMTLGDSWLCVGELAGRAERDGVEKTLKGRFLSAWTREAGALKMVAWQTTPLS